MSCLGNDTSQQCSMKSKKEKQNLTKHYANLLFISQYSL